MSHEISIQIHGYMNTDYILNKWEDEDAYYSRMNASYASVINRTARKYPYIASSESTSGTLSLTIDIPLVGPIDLVYLDGRSDAGLPHTRGKSGIALPIFLLWHPNEKTIQHELVHLSQKQFPERWWSWYRQHWNFRIAKEEEFMRIPEKWRRRRRINPDTLGVQYTIWNNRYIPLSVFSTLSRPDLRYCKRGFWDTMILQWTWEPPSGWISVFGSGFNDEHPHEIIAHWIDGSAGEEKRKYFHLHPV